MGVTPTALQKCIESWLELAPAIELEPQFKHSHLGLLCTRGLIRVGSVLKGMVNATSETAHAFKNTGENYVQKDTGSIGRL